MVKNYGGILLRSVVGLTKSKEDKSEFTKEKFQGPQVVAMEIFSNLHPLDGAKKNEITLVNAKEYIPDADFPLPVKMIKTSRVGLSKAAAKIEFRDELLRCIALFSGQENFNYKIKGIDSLISEQYKSGNITIEDARAILGYNKTFVQVS